MSKTGDMALEQQTCDEMAREAGPELAEALSRFFSNSISSMSGTGYYGLRGEDIEFARAALRKAGLEP